MKKPAKAGGLHELYVLRKIARMPRRSCHQAMVMRMVAMAAKLHEVSV